MRPRTALLLALLLTPLLPAGAAAQRLDPDRCWTCRDSFEHAGAGAAVDLIGTAVSSRPAVRVALVALAGAAFELGQADVARSQNLKGRGFGFGLKDLACDVLGALAAEGLRKLL